MRMRTIVQHTAWPLCLLANTVPLVVVAMLAPDALPQAASAVTVVLMLVLLLAERLATDRPDWLVADDSEIWRDLGHVVAYAIAVAAARLLFLGALAAALAHVGLRDALRIWPSQWPVAVQVVLVIVIGDLLEYGFHRLSHTQRWLWPLHALHHTPVRLNVVKGGRHHLLYAFGRGVAVWTPLLLLGAPAQLIYWQFIAITITGLVGHANVRFRIPAFAHRLLVTPQFHRLHHAADPRVGHNNFGVVFAFWDIAFRSHADPLRVRFWDAGIRDDPIPRRFVDELKSPFTYARLAACRDGRRVAPSIDRDQPCDRLPKK